MDVVFTHCAGLDVHKKTVVDCRVTPDPAGQQADGVIELKAFGTMTEDLLWKRTYRSRASAPHPLRPHGWAAPQCAMTSTWGR
jgi:hypothetical protein